MNKSTWPRKRIEDALEQGIRLRPGQRMTNVPDSTNAPGGALPPIFLSAFLAARLLFQERPSMQGRMLPSDRSTLIQ